MVCICKTILNDNGDGVPKNMSCPEGLFMEHEAVRREVISRHPFGEWVKQATKIPRQPFETNHLVLAEG